MRKMNIDEELHYVNDILQKAVLSEEERYALVDLMSLIRHEFNSMDTVRELIDNHICTVRWSVEDVIQIAEEEGVCLEPSDVVSICTQHFKNNLKEICVNAGSDYISGEASEYEIFYQ